VPNRPIEGISQEATDEFRSPGIYVQLFDTEGVVVAHSFNLGAQELPVPAADIHRALAGESFFAATEISGQPVQLFYRPVGTMVRLSAWRRWGNRWPGWRRR
jgi:hypothetical protein